MNTDHLTPGAGPYKLTDAQVMLLWEEVFAKPGRSAIPTNILGFYLLIPQGDPTALSRAFNKVLETNDSLRLQLFRLDRRAARDNRTDYPYIGLFLYRYWLRGVRQAVADYVSQTLPEVAVADWQAFQDHIASARMRPMPLLGCQLYSAEIVRIGPADIALHARFHHLTIDGYSFKLLFEQLVTFYEQYQQGLEPQPPRYSITRYFQQDEQYRQSPRLTKDIAYWKRVFTKQPHFSFPAGRTPMTSHYLTVERSLTGARYQACCDLSARIGVGCSNYALLMFVAAMTVYRLSGRTNFAMFHMSHGRIDPAGKQTIGAMINMIPVFYNLAADRSFEQTIQACRTAYVESMMHSRLPFNELMKFYTYESIRHGFNANHAWIVFSSLEFEATVAQTAYQAATIGAKNQPHQFFNGIMEIPGERISLQVRYQTVKYNQRQVETYLDAYLDTFDRVVRQPEAPLSSLRT